MDNYIDISKLNISNASAADCIIALDYDKNLIVIKNNQKEYDDTEIKNDISEINNALAEKANINQIPTKTSQLTNDSGYLTSIPSNYVTNTELNNAIADKANTNQIPTKTSELTNDSGYLTSIPSNYVTDTELSNSLSEYIKTDEISDFITEQDLEIALTNYVTDTELSNSLTGKQNTLVSGVNIKTINGTSILGNGDIVITGSGESVDLSNYYNKQEVDSLIDNCVTNTELEAKGYLTSIPSEYVTATEINAELKNYPTFTELENELQTYVEFPDLEDYVTNTELNNAIADKANTNQIPTKTSQLTNDSGYLTGVPSEYVTESELTNELDAKQNTLVSGVNIKTINGTSILGDGNIELSSGNVDLGDYYNKQEVDLLINTCVTNTELTQTLQPYALVTQIPKIEYVTQSEYDSMAKDATTLYIIIG